ncbi:MAG: M23 family metallopeptidase [Pseudomonadota bacterium]
MRCVLAFLGLFAATACATAPAPRANLGSSIHVCAGGGANLPATDRSRRVVGFEPVISIAGNQLLSAPVPACISSGFGPRRGGAGDFHKGVDFFTGSPRTFVAAGDGVVTFIGRQRGYGRVIIIRHRNGVETRYAHLSKFSRSIREGARVRQGEPLGLTGDSGNATAVHLHYEIRVRGAPINPMLAGS